MAFKTMLFVLASVLLVTTKVSSKNEDFVTEAVYAKAPVAAPRKGPAPPSLHVPVEAPVPSPPVKAPTPAPPARTPVPAPSVKPPPRNTKECYPLCLQRCKLHSRKNVCLRACVTCCDRCKCVPPGTYGNREKCGACYTNMTTRGNRPKCP